jgi:hypothetical protein
MLERGASKRSIRRTLTALGCVTLVVATVAVSGCVVQDAPFAGLTCNTPTTVYKGFFVNGQVAFRVAMQQNPSDSRTTWVCLQLKAGANFAGGRVDVRGPSVLGTPTVDANSRACATGTNNLVPPPHPIEQGSVLGTPFYFDVYAGDGGTWLCLEVGAVKQRLVFPPLLDAGLYQYNVDTSPTSPAGAIPPPAGKPSSSCYEGAYGRSTELINARLGDRDMWLYTAKPSDTELHVCARLSGAQSGGGHLSVNAAPDQIVRIDQSTDTSSCTHDIVTLTNPPTSLKISPPGQAPPSVCVNGTRYTVVTGPIPPVVSWTPDM